MPDYKTPVINIGILGLGTVGTGVYKIIKKEAKAIEEKAGVRLVLRKVCDKYLDKERVREFPKAIFTRDVDDLLNDASIHILVELIGGLHPAKEIIQKAISRGKHVVTANKALLAEEGDFLFKEMLQGHSEVGIEASVCGAIPIIKSIRESLASGNIQNFLGIVNGTCNYILTQMTHYGMDFKTALSEAQMKGYAERNPELDIEGFDSAHKLAILSRLAFRAKVPFKKIYVEGIKGISASDIQYAKEMGYVIKLLAIGKRGGQRLQLRVHPTLLTLEHPLATVKGVFNAVFVSSDQAGDLLFYGRGAGMYPAASAVVGDIIDSAKKITAGSVHHKLRLSCEKKLAVVPIEEIYSRYYLRFQVTDKPGVLGRIARTLGRYRISILSVQQKESHQSKSVPVVMLTYQALEKDLRQALARISAQKEVVEKTVVIRVES